MKLSKAGIANYVARVVVAATSFITVAGCSAGEVNDGEMVGKVTSALGSTEQRQDINNWTQLTQMTATGNYLLKVDLNASGKSWTPKAFSGTFDGGGKTISNLTINTVNNANIPDAGFFASLENAIVRNVKFVNLNVSARYQAGGVAGTAGDSQIDSVSVQGTVTAPGAVGLAAGGIVGTGGNVKISFCSMKGTVGSSLRYAGGIAGYLNAGSDRSVITQSYSWATISPNTSEAGRDVWAGGIVGWIFGGTVTEVYAVGNVTGRGHAGGLVGSMDCEADTYPSVFNHGIYRGEVVDANRSSASGGWSGTFGTYQDCASRFDQLIWNKSMDGSTTTGVKGDAQKSATEQELISPTTVSGGAYNYQDNKFTTIVWDPGTATQHHALKGMPGGLTVQPRCMVNGVPTAC